MLSRLIVTCCILMALAVQSVQAEPAESKLGFEQVVDRILRNYPSLEVARLQVARANQEVFKVESQLGWELSGNGGVSHDVSFFGTPSDRGDINVSLDRQLASGHSIGVSGNYTYEDSSFTVSPQFPNPSHATELDLNYRIPLGQGEGNPDYTEGLAGAEANIKAERAGALSLRNDIANQALELFYAKAMTEARLDSANQGLQNARRLENYISRQRELGLAEEKDTLQARAQADAQQTDVRQLEVQLEQQQIALNRLMGEPWARRYESSLHLETKLTDYAIDELITQAEKYYPPLQQNLARLEVTETILRRSRDQRKDKLDLVLSVGTRTRSGDAAGGSISEEDMAGLVRFEYSESLDKSGLDAEVLQAQLDRTIALEEIRNAREELTYSLASLVREISATRRALESGRQHLQSEEEKFKEALQRYRQGREQTDRLIQYENERNEARLTVAEQQVELARRINALRILHGTFWTQIAGGMELP